MRQSPLLTLAAAAALAVLPALAKAQKPPQETPGTPPEEPRPRDPGDEDKPEFYGRDQHVCPEPERHEKCAALVIDLQQKDVVHELHGIGAALEKLGCDVVEFEAEFQDPKDPRLGAGEAERKNAELWAELDKKVAAHLKHVENAGKGRNLVIDLISAHGSKGETVRDWPNGDVETCGGWSGLNFGKAYSRSALLDKIYPKVKSHACGWMVYDSSCYSGLTPKGFDKIENDEGKATCENSQALKHSAHAAYWADIAAGTSSEGDACMAGDNGTGKDAKEILSALDALVKEPRKPGADAVGAAVVEKLWKIFKARPSVYADHGYLEVADPHAPAHVTKGYSK